MTPYEYLKQPIDSHTHQAAQALRQTFKPGRNIMKPDFERLCNLTGGRKVWRFKWKITSQFVFDQNALGGYIKARHNDARHNRLYVLDVDENGTKIDYIIDPDATEQQTGKRRNF